MNPQAIQQLVPLFQQFLESASGSTAPPAPPTPPTQLPPAGYQLPPQAPPPAPWTRQPGVYSGLVVILLVVLQFFYDPMLASVADGIAETRKSVEALASDVGSIKSTVDRLEGRVSSQEAVNQNLTDTVNRLADELEYVKRITETARMTARSVQSVLETITGVKIEIDIPKPDEQAD